MNVYSLQAEGTSSIILFSIAIVKPRSHFCIQVSTEFTEILIRPEIQNISVKPTIRNLKISDKINDVTFVGKFLTKVNVESGSKSIRFGQNHDDPEKNTLQIALKIPEIEIRPIMDLLQIITEMWNWLMIG